MENDKNFFLYGVLSVIIFIIFIFSFKICKADTTWDDDFESYATGTSLGSISAWDNMDAWDCGWVYQESSKIFNRNSAYSINSCQLGLTTPLASTTQTVQIDFYIESDNTSTYPGWIFFKNSLNQTWSQLTFDDFTENFFEIKMASTSFGYYNYDYWHTAYFLVDTLNNKIHVNIDEGEWEMIDSLLMSDVKYIQLFSISIIDIKWDNLISSSTYEFYDSVEVIELPDYSGNIQIGSETKLQYNRYNTCYINKPCYFKVNYGYDEIGSDLVFYYFDTATMIDYTTLADSTYLTYTFSVPIETDETLRTHCLILDNSTTTPEYFCDISINWLSFPECSEENMCEDVATSSDFLYGVQCGARQTVCWLFNPSDTSIQFLQNNVQNMENSFPFNLAFGLINEVSDTMETSTSTGVDLGLPSVIDNEYIIVNGISSSSFSEVFGTSTTYMIEDYATYIIWLLVAVGVSIIIIKYAIL
jgi:hypothetical protein